MFTSDKELRKPRPKPKRPSSSASSALRPASNQRGCTDSTITTVTTASSSGARNMDSHIISHQTQSIGSGSGRHEGGGSEDIIERSKRERVAREELRAQRRHVVTIQAWLRGRHSAQLWRSGQRQEFDNKLGDLEKVSALLKQTKGIILVPPLSVSVSLLRMLLVGRFLPRDHVRLLRYCESILSVSLAELDQQKNLIVFLTTPVQSSSSTSASLEKSASNKRGHSDHDKDTDLHRHGPPPLFLLQQLLRALFEVIDSSTATTSSSSQGPLKNGGSASIGGVSQPQCRSVLVPCVALLLGLETPFRLRVPEPLRRGFAVARCCLLRDTGTAEGHRHQARASSSSSSSGGGSGGGRVCVFECVGRSLYLLALRGKHLDPHVSEDRPSSCTSTQCGGMSASSSSSQLADALVDLSLRLALFSPDQEEGKEGGKSGKEEWERLFATHLLGVPLGTFLLSKAVLARLASPSALSLLLAVLLPPPPSSSSVGTFSSTLFSSSSSSSSSSPRVMADVTCILPPSSHPVFVSGQWALGNLASLFPFLPLTPSDSGLQSTSLAGAGAGAGAGAASAEYAIVSDQLLGQYMDVLSALLVAHRVPGVLQGKSGVLWHRAGAVLSASGVPLGLQQQVLGVLDKPTCLRLYSRVLRPLPLPPSSASSAARVDTGNSSKSSNNSSGVGGGGGSQFQRVPPASKEDMKDITSAFSSSGIKLAQKDMKDRQTERAVSNSYFGLGATSVWAKKLSKSLGGMLFGSGSEKSSTETLQQQMVQQQELTRGASSSGGSAVTSESKVLLDNEPLSLFPLNPATVQSLCSLWSLLLPPAATGATPDSAPWQALSALCFSTRVVGRLWGYALNASSASSSSGSSSKFASTSSSSAGSGGGGTSPDFELGRDLFPNSASVQSRGVAAVTVLVAVLKIQLIALDDAELYEQELPVPLPYLLPLVRCLNHQVYSCLCADPGLLLEVSLPLTSEGGGGGGGKESDAREVTRAYQKDSLRCAVAVLADLHTRWARRPFASPALWEISQASSCSNLRADLKHVLLQPPSRGDFSQGQSKHLLVARAVLRLLPWALPFYDRVKLFREVVAAERLAVQGSDDINAGNRSRGTVVKVRRQRLLSDGMTALERVGGAIKDRVVVRYVNDFGEDESGIDVGGLFKDFLTDLSERVFNPNFGLFSLTSQQQLYPHPSAAALLGHDPHHPHEMEDTFAFIGRVLGKALFEDITIQPQFAHFFLAFMMGKYNFTGLLNDLSSLDPDLHKNLTFLKSYEGDLADLCLTFSASAGDEMQGGGQGGQQHQEVEFFPGGGEVAVTNDNRHRYIQLAAKYYLHDRLVAQARAFFGGLYQVISPELLGMFCAPELQVLISGADTEIDLADLRAHTRYAGGYHALHPSVAQFWQVMEAAGDTDRALLVKFVTSCQRPPSLGFGALNPPFCIQQVESEHDTRLPTASTCFNVLKLPAYSSRQIMNGKLLAAVRSNSGFELS